MARGEIFSGAFTRAGTSAGIAWMALSGVLFVAMTAAVRLAGSSMPIAQSAFIRYLFGVLLVIPVLVKLRPKVPTGHSALYFLLRGLAHGGAVMFWFYAITRIPLAEVTALSYTTPVFVVIGAALFLGERVSLERIAAMAVAFAGVLIVLRPGFATVEWGQLAQLASAPLFAASALAAKQLTKTEEPALIVAMLTIGCTLVLMVPALLDWQTPKGGELFWLFLTAIFATAAHYCQTKSYHAAPITVTLPISYLQIVWSTIAGLMLFGDHPDAGVFIGGGLILTAVIVITRREATRARRKVTG
ncbi:MAG: DMT family transporter [Hyphomicrobiales bacterium]